MRSIVIAAVVFTLYLAGCGGGGGGGGGERDTAVQRFVIPSGASLTAIAESLSTHEIIRGPHLFGYYVRLRGADGTIKAGTYELPKRSGWSKTLEALVEGRVVTVAVTVPEGWRLTQIAQRIAPIAEVSADSIVEDLLDPALADSFGLPGPTLEGYLFPETYRFAAGVPLLSIVKTLSGRYKAIWTPGRRTLLDSLGMSEREATTLASIVQAEARWVDEMPLISAVYHNRLKRGMRLQADPTVQYALETRRSRLLYRDIESVADNPYNTYTHAGLPPGPIGAPGLAAIDAALSPADVPYLYFVARPDGRHEFSRSLVEHNRKIQEIRQARRRLGN